jgi:hypothetical protein
VCFPSQQFFHAKVGERDAPVLDHLRNDHPEPDPFKERASGDTGFGKEALNSANTGEPEND